MSFFFPSIAGVYQFRQRATFGRKNPNQEEVQLFVFLRRSFLKFSSGQTAAPSLCNAHSTVVMDRSEHFVVVALVLSSSLSRDIPTFCCRFCFFFTFFCSELLVLLVHSRTCSKRRVCWRSGARKTRKILRTQRGVNSRRDVPRYGLGASFGQ